MIPIARKMLQVFELLTFCLVQLEDGIKIIKDSDILTDEHLTTVRKILDNLELHLKDLKLTESLKKIDRIRKRIADRAINFGEHRQQAEALSELIDSELDNVIFGFIPTEKTKYHNNRFLFGEDVYKNFPSARDEIKEAGNCYALGLNTACVFHLMRAVEVVLKRMIVAMKAQKYLTKPDKKSPTGKIQVSVDVCDQDTLIKALRSALKDLESGKSISAKKKATHAFYSGAVNTFCEFKDAYRNPISHGNKVADENRKLYKEGETSDIMKSVRHFMTHLAKRIKE